MEAALQEVATGFGLLEAPLWVDGHGLYFSDVLNGGVHLLDDKRQVSLVAPSDAESTAWRGMRPAGWSWAVATSPSRPSKRASSHGRT
jgi:sugar lactone lactonase YvrE